MEIVICQGSVEYIDTLSTMGLVYVPNHIRVLVYNSASYPSAIRTARGEAIMAIPSSPVTSDSAGTLEYYLPRAN